MYGRALTRFFWDSYDYLGRLILLCFLGSVASLCLFPIPGVVIALIYFAHVVAQDKEPDLSAVFLRAKQLYFKSLKLCLIFLLLIFVLFVNVRFYLNPGIIPEFVRIPAAIIAGFCFWAFIFLTMTSLYAFPILIKHELSLKETLKRAALIVLINPFYSLLILITMIGLCIICTVSVVGVFLLLPGLLGSLTNAAYDTLLEKYEEGQKKETVQRMPQQPSSWKEIKKKEELTKKKPDRYSRKLKDILRPWEY